MSLNRYYLRQLFQPTLLSIFINPFYLVRKELYIEIRKLAPELHGIMMDFGCGLKSYRNLFSNVEKYIGVDIKNEGHSHEKEDIDVYYDGHHIPFNDGYFDSVFCSEVIEHVFNLSEILQEINRVMKPGAKILLTVPFSWDEHEIPNDFGRYTSYGIKHILENHGFIIDRCEKIGHFSEVIGQLRILYLHHMIYSNNKYLNLIINLLCISPFTVWTLIVSTLLPKKYSLYFGNIVLAHKR
jgi:SAM-dependent methyltransferase